MKIQVCRQCGNRNTVVSKSLKSCNYCGSSDLEAITETDASLANETASNGGLKWLILLFLIIAMAAAGFWAWQSFIQKDSVKSSAAKLPSFLHDLSDANAPTEILPNSAKEAIESASNQTATEFTATQSNLEQAEDKIKRIIEPEESKKPQDLVISSKVADVEKSNLVDKKAEVTPLSQAELLALSKDKQTQQAEIEPLKIESALEASKISSTNKTEALSKVKVASVNKAQAQIELKPEVKPQPKLVPKVAPKVTQSPKPKLKPKPKAKPVAKKAVVKKPAATKPKPEIKKPVLSASERNAQRNKMRVLDYGNGIVTDRKTGLMWMACSNGQTWNGQSCSGESLEFLWSEAVELGKQSNYANYSDWRLPTRKELNTIVSCSNGRLPFKLDEKGQEIIKNGRKQNGQCLGRYAKPTIDSKVFPNTESSLYWSYSHSAANNYSAWGVFFSKGYQLNYNTTNTGYVRLVRSIR